MIYNRSLKGVLKFIGLIFVLVVILISVLGAIEDNEPNSDPEFYLKKDTWYETMIASREALVEIEHSGDLGTIMPDLGSSNFTLTSWIKTSASSGVIFMKSLNLRTSMRESFDPKSQNKALYIKDGKPAYEISSIGIFEADIKVNDDQWHHIALAGNNPLEFYIDGIKVKSGIMDNSDKINADNINHVFSLGAGQRRFPVRGSFDGVIDEARIYNRKLTAKEIETLYYEKENVSKGLTGWWRFENEAEDASINNHRGRIFQGEITSGKTGSGVRLNRRGVVWLDRSTGLTARNVLWTCIARDFSDEQARNEIEIEKQDNIWDTRWSSGSFSELAETYASTTRAIGGLQVEANKLLEREVSINEFKTVRNIYHLSILSKNVYDDLSSKVGSLRSAVNYLMEKHLVIYTNGSDYLSRLDNLEKQLADMVTQPANFETLLEMRKDFQQMQYTALITDNPLIDFDQLVFIKRYTYQSSHYYTDFIDGTENPGGNLCVYSLKDGSVRELLPQMSGGIFGRYDLSFDGKKIVFDWKEKIGKGFRLFEVGIDGKGLRQLTFEPEDEEERIKRYDNSFLGGTGRVYQHHTDDMHPCYLPDGGICFSSSRCEFGTLCDGPDILSTAVLYRIDGDGSNMVKLTNSAVSEFSPSIMNDGRILYSRWEYIDKGQIGVKCLWAMHPDGSNTVEIFGNDIALPPVFIHSRAIPGYPNQFVVLGTPHFPSSGVGTVIRLDINKPIRTREPMTYITPHIDIRAEGGFHHWVDDKWVQTQNGPLYMDPFPLSDKFFLVSHNPDKRWNDISAYGLYLLDEFANHVLIYQDPEFSSWQPIPLTARPTPPVIPSVIPEKQEEEVATVVVSDVYVGLEGVERGTIKYLRIMEQVPRPWGARRFWDIEGRYGGHSLLSRSTVLGLKVLHGIVPVYEDGSAHFTVPANKNTYFQALDENFMEVQRERTYINYRPGEKRSCIGCHNLRRLAPVNKTNMALNYPPSKPQAQPGEIAPRVVHYPTDVQPILDKHCITCHGGENPAADLKLTGELTTFFNESYENIIERGLVVTTNEGSDFDGTEPVPPKSIGSHASKFIQVLRSGHEQVSLTQEEFIKLVTWVDANAQYYGAYFGKKNIAFKDDKIFRPIPTFEQAIHALAPWDQPIKK